MINQGYTGKFDCTDRVWRFLPWPEGVDVVMITWHIWDHCCAQPAVFSQTAFPNFLSLACQAASEACRWIIVLQSEQSLIPMYHISHDS